MQVLSFGSRFVRYRNSTANVDVGFVCLTEVVTINGLDERIACWQEAEAAKSQPNTC
jgi:hypothetical protein